MTAALRKNLGAVFIWVIREESSRIQLPIAGTTALAHYSMLDESNRPTYAVTKKNLSEIDFSAGRQTPAGEIPGCTIRESKSGRYT